MLPLLGYTVTHVLSDRMVAVAQTTFPNVTKWMKYLYLDSNLDLNLVPKGPKDNKSALVQIMDWRRTGDKSLPEQMLPQFTNVYMRY